MISQFRKTGEIYNIDARGGRRIFHEVFTLSDSDMLRIQNEFLYEALDFVGKKAARKYVELGYQTVYAVHFGKRPHIHFAINAVSFADGYKWHARRTDIWQREKMLNELLLEFANQVNPITSFEELYR